MRWPSTADPDPGVVTLLDAQAPPLVAFVRARSPAEGDAALAAAPGLLGGDYDDVIDELIAIADRQRATAAGSVLEERRAQLETLRDATTGTIATQLGQIAVLAQQRAAAGDPASCDRALVAWQRYADAPGLADLPPARRGFAFNRLGIAHAYCLAAGRGEEHEAHALLAFERAVAEDPDTEYRLNVLRIRLALAQRSERPPLDELLALAQDIVAEAHPDSRSLPEAKALLDRILAMGRPTATPVVTGIEVGDDVLAQARCAVEAGRSGSDRADDLDALAHAAYDGAYASGRLDLLDEAIGASEACLRLTPPAGDVYARRVGFFGMLLRQRHQDRHDAGDLWKAVSALRVSVQRTPTAHPEWTGRAMNLGNALGQLHELTGERFPLDEAIALLEEVRERSPTDAAERRQQLSALSRVLRVRFAADGDRADLERSVALDAEALEGVPAAHPERALLLVNAAHGLARMSTNRDADWARAVELWREGCTIGVAQQPALALTAAITWLDLALQRGAAEDATDGTGLALDALEQLVASQGARQDQEQWLHLAAPLPAMAARVLVAADEPEQAVLAVERGRALLLSLLLERSGGVERPTLAQLRDLAAQGPLIYLVPGDGAMALVVEPSRVSVVPLAGLSETAVTDAVSRLYRAYYHRRDDRDGWRASFDDVTRWLWTAAMAPVLAAVPEASTVNLLPGGLLALLPLHAAWAPDAARASGRRYACDEAQIALQANAHLLLRPASAPLGRAGLLVAVADPRPTSETPLPWALAEAQAAAAAFDRSRILAHEEATPENVAELAEDAAVIHWACHGRADIEHPLSGGLVLAGDHVLSLEAVQTSRLTARLVVASACESASVAPGLPNEVVNFAAAVLQAGAEAVLATAFAVDDFTALLVCTRFYGAWRPGVRGPEALREAAAFVRDSTNAEKLAWVQELRSQGMPRTVTDAIEGVLAFAAPEQRSFAAPVEWAPFTWWGRHVVA